MGIVNLKVICGLKITDEEYAQLLTQGYDSDLERQLIIILEDRDKARSHLRTLVEN